MMIKIASWIIKHKKAVLIAFILATVLSTVAQFFVKVNYNMVDYLPDDAQSTQALDIMEREFTGA
ncbi:hypothetical protein R0J91_21610, partial [Micrococcus sp. SIMBA_131]